MRQEVRPTEAWHKARTSPFMVRTWVLNPASKRTPIPYPRRWAAWPCGSYREARLFFGEYLRMKNRIDIAQFVHRAAKRREMEHIRPLETAQEYPNGRYAADHGGACFG